MIRFDRKRHQRKRRQLSIGENNFLFDSCYYCCCCCSAGGCCCFHCCINWFAKCFFPNSIKNQCTDGVEEQTRNKHSFNDDHINVLANVYDYFDAVDDIIDPDANDRINNKKQTTIERSNSTIDYCNKPTAVLALDNEEIVLLVRNTFDEYGEIF